MEEGGGQQAEKRGVGRGKLKQRRPRTMAEPSNLAEAEWPSEKKKKGEVVVRPSKAEKERPPWPRPPKREEKDLIVVCNKTPIRI